MTRRTLLAATVWAAALGAVCPADAGRVVVTPVDGATAAAGGTEFRGVAAGAFDPKLWTAGELHFVPDGRHPMIEPRAGSFRNIYAPSVVQLPAGNGWRLFYGAWDGVPTGNDRIYSVDTRDFLTFDNRRTVIEHGAFQHVCNVSGIRLADGAYAMTCTGYPDEKGLNKPVFFSSPDGKTWNGSAEPYPAKRDDIVTIEGYPKYSGADVNGMNVILHEGGRYRLYFCNFKDFGKVYRASGTDGKHWTFDGPVMDAALAVNDVKRFRAGGQDWYLMGLHLNGPAVHFAVSRDGAKFPPPRVLFGHLDDADKYMVAVGWVTDGDQEAEGRRVLGVLYGAGAVGSLDQNRIFARWLQKRVVVETETGTVEVDRAVGPDGQRAAWSEKVVGRIALYREDGKTLIGRSDSVALEPGRVYLIAEQP
jgi:hypothetical protein